MLGTSAKDYDSTLFVWGTSTEKKRQWVCGVFETSSLTQLWCPPSCTYEHFGTEALPAAVKSSAMFSLEFPGNTANYGHYRPKKYRLGFSRADRICLYFCSAWVLSSYSGSIHLIFFRKHASQSFLTYRDEESLRNAALPTAINASVITCLDHFRDERAPCSEPASHSPILVSHKNVFGIRVLRAKKWVPMSRQDWRLVFLARSIIHVW